SSVGKVLLLSRHSVAATTPHKALALIYSTWRASHDGLRWPPAKAPAHPSSSPQPPTMAGATHVRPNWPDFAYSSRRWAGVGTGTSKMQSEYVVSVLRRDYAARADSISRGITAGAFECKPCGVAVTAEAVSGTHMLIENITPVSQSETAQKPM